MESDDRDYSAADVQRSAGLTYRQLNDWDSRGALPHDRTGERGWRKFSLKEIFILSICNELHTRFGVPLQRLGYVREFMAQPGANHFSAAVDLMSMLGVGVWLLTDLEETFIMDSELEFIDLVQHQFLGGEKDSAYLFLKVNPIVNRILEATAGVQIEAHGRGYEILREIHDLTGVRSDAERAVLEAIRSDDASRIEITLKDSSVETIRTTDYPRSSEQLNALLDANDYQKLTIVKRDGQVVSIERQTTEKVT